MLGISGMLGGLFISQAYRLSEAAFAAPFEYVAMPMAIMWGVTVFGTWPDATAWIGIALIVGSGLYLLWRESVKDATVATKAPTYRR
jgi:drug/metabolite transporter (DMT)-like permease